MTRARVCAQADKIQPEEFFGTIAEFAKQFDAAKGEVMKGREVKMKVDPKRKELLKVGGWGRGRCLERFTCNDRKSRRSTLAAS